MDFQALFLDIPAVTRTYLAGCVLTTACCATGIISPFSLYFSVHMIFAKGQIWRLITNFLYFGSKFGLDFFFHMFFLTRYARSLEQETFAGRKADFAWMLVMGAGIMLLIAPLASLPFLGNSLTFMLVYLWSRRNPFTRISFLGFFNFTAPYLPWVLLGFSMLLENDVKIDLLGILVGHLYYFSRFVYPEMTNNQIELFKTPHFMRDSMCIRNEFERIKQGKDFKALDTNRYAVRGPTKDQLRSLSGANRESVWRSETENAYARMSEEENRIQNLELCKRFGTFLWAKHAEEMSKIDSWIGDQVSGVQESKNNINRKRAYEQSRKKPELEQLEAEWWQLVTRNNETQLAIELAERKVKRLKLTAKKRGLL